MKKKIIWSVVAMFIVLIGALAIHIYISTQPDPNERQIQLSRIDFKQPVDSLEASKIRSFVRGLDGVDGTNFNVKDGILVYTYFVDSHQTSDNVFQKVVALGNYKAQKYVVDESKAASGCPIMNPNSVSFRVYTYFKRIF